MGFLEKKINKMIEPPSVRFKENLSDFFDFIIDLIETARREHPQVVKWEVEPIKALYKLLHVYKSDDVMRMWVTKTHLVWDKIKKRDTDFFATTKTLLDQTNDVLPVKGLNTNIFVELIEMRHPNTGQYIIHRDNIDVIWKYWDAFVLILIDHVHHKRGPRTRILPDGKRQAVYTAKYVPTLDVQSTCRIWQVDLRF